MNDCTRNTKYGILRSNLLRILGAEDERDILLQYELALKSSGHDVTSTSDGGVHKSLHGRNAEGHSH